MFAADEIDAAGLKCPPLPEHTQRELREFTPVAGSSVRNPVDTIAIFEPPKLERTLTVVGRAENIDVVMFHASFSWGAGRRTSALTGGMDLGKYMELMVEQVVRAREATGKPIAVVVRPPLDGEGMERTSLFQERCWSAPGGGLPVFPTIPRAANAIAKLRGWRQGREAGA